MTWPCAIRKSQRALFRALKLMRENPREAAELVSKKLGWTPEAVLGAHKISGPLLPVDGQIKKKLPIGDHYTREFTPVRV